MGLVAVDDQKDVIGFWDLSCCWVGVKWAEVTG